MNVYLGEETQIAAGSLPDSVILDVGYSGHVKPIDQFTNIHCDIDIMDLKHQMMATHFTPDTGEPVNYPCRYNYASYHDAASRMLNLFPTNRFGVKLSRAAGLESHPFGIRTPLEAYGLRLLTIYANKYLLHRIPAYINQSDYFATLDNQGPSESGIKNYLRLLKLYMAAGITFDRNYIIWHSAKEFNPDYNDKWNPSFEKGYYLGYAPKDDMIELNYHHRIKIFREMVVSYYTKATFDILDLTSQIDLSTIALNYSAALNRVSKLIMAIIDEPEYITLTAAQPENRRDLNMSDAWFYQRIPCTIPSVYRDYLKAETTKALLTIFLANLPKIEGRISQLKDENGQLKLTWHSTDPTKSISLVYDVEQSKVTGVTTYKETATGPAVDRYYETNPLERFVINDLVPQKYMEQSLSIRDEFTRTGGLSRFDLREYYNIDTDENPNTLLWIVGGAAAAFIASQVV